MMCLGMPLYYNILAGNRITTVLAPGQRPRERQVPRYN